jgi:hypothetical protein
MSHPPFLPTAALEGEKLYLQFTVCATCRTEMSVATPLRLAKMPTYCDACFYAGNVPFDGEYQHVPDSTEVTFDHYQKLPD